MLTNLGACKPTFHTVYTSHLTVWGETALWAAVFIIQTSDRMQYFTILKCKLYSFSIQKDRSTRGLLAKPLKKFYHLYNGQPVASCEVFDWTSTELHFNIIKNSLCLFFLFNGFITMCKLKKRLIRATFWVLLQAMFMNDWKH